MKDVVIIDCQNDFIDGSMAVENGREVVNNIIEFLDEDMKVYYTSDFHSSDHISFNPQGGPWPAHCVEGTLGAEIDDAFYNTSHAPNDENVYFKGRNPKYEEYSGFKARNSKDKTLNEILSDEVIVVGIASEFCVRETALDLKNSGKNVIIYKDLLGYVDRENHEANIEDLKEKGIEVR